MQIIKDAPDATRISFVDRVTQSVEHDSQGHRRLIKGQNAWHKLSVASANS